MKKLLLVIGFSLFVSCGAPISGTAVTVGIQTAQTLLNIIAQVLGPSVRTSQALCEEKTREGLPTADKARFECATINDAWENVDAHRAAAETALQSGDQTRIDEATGNLDRAVKELRGVMAESSTVAP